MRIQINRTLADGIKILLLFENPNSLFTVAEISKRLGYSQSKTYRLVSTLASYRLLKVNPATAQYSLGLNVLRLGLLTQQQYSISENARPFMKELSLLTKETVLLLVVNGTKGIVLERVESPEPIRYTLYQPGATIPLHSGASGKLLMAYLKEEEWDHIIKEEGMKAYTPNTITDADQLKSHLKEIQKSGCAYSDQEVERDARAVAAPILDRLGRLVAGLSIIGPVFRINRKKVSSLKKLVIEYAQKISSSI
jgi:IclR family transcriptional regulator, KDG regulon repressor